jgi:hypothetical protein
LIETVIRRKHVAGVVAGLVPAAPVVLAPSLKTRDRRDKSGDDAVIRTT